MSLENLLYAIPGHMAVDNNSTKLLRVSTDLHNFKQGVALTGRNSTGPPCSVGRPTVHAPGPAVADCPHARRPARPPAALQTTTNASEQNNTGPLGGPVINNVLHLCNYLLF